MHQDLPENPIPSPILPNQTSSESELASEASHTVADGPDIGETEHKDNPLKLVPISPESFGRYMRRRTITKRNIDDYVVPPLSRSFSRAPPPQWIPEHHPEGGLYFVHEQKRVFTDAYLYDPAVLAQITSIVNQLSARAEVEHLLIDDSIDIILDLMNESADNDECGYYLADHSARIIFWLDPFNMSTLDNWTQILGIDAPSHVKLCLEVEYWLHCEYFPAAMPISTRGLDELRDTIIYAIGDSITSTTTTQSLPVEHLFRMLIFAREIVCAPVSATSDSARGKKNHGSAAVFARFMVEFARARFFNFHGEKTARLNNDESVYGDIAKPSYTLTWLSLLLFNSPLRHLEILQVVNMDRLINYASWQRFITGLRSEWLDIVLYGTLILNTNVGFLSIPASGASSAGRVASYTSICVGLASIILGILFLRKYDLNTPDVPDVTTAAELFYFHGSSAHRLEALSVALSLPFALEIWALISFVIAFLITVFETSGVEVRAIMFATVATVCVAIIGFIWTEKRFVWAKRMTDTKMKMGHAGSLMWNSWPLRSPRRKPQRNESPIFP